VGHHDCLRPGTFSYFFLSRPLLLVGVGGASDGVELRPLPLLEGVLGRGEEGGEEVLEVLLDADVREDLLTLPLVGKVSRSIMVPLPLVVLLVGGVDITHLFLAGGGVKVGGDLDPGMFLFMELS